MNAIDLLDTQHRDVDDLFARLERQEGDAATRQRMFDDLADMLAIHASIEEMHFYPAVNAARTEAILEHSLEEHVDIKRKLALCLATRSGSDKFLDRLRALKHEVQQHVREEQTELFPRVRELFDADQLEALGQEMTSTMAQLQQGRPRFDVPLQTLAPMPLTELPGQGGISSRVMPHLSRLLALPLQMLGVAKQAKKTAIGFARSLERSINKKRRSLV